MTLYRKRPVTVEAFQWQPDIVTMDGKIPLPEWLEHRATANNESLEVWTIKGVLKVWPGDWVVKNVGEIGVVSNKQFHALYEVVDG